jgi:hypothetical protein
MGDASDACRDRLHALARFQKVMRNGQGQAGGRNANDRKQCREIDARWRGSKAAHSSGDGGSAGSSALALCMHAKVTCALAAEEEATRRKSAAACIVGGSRVR